MNNGVESTRIYRRTLWGRIERVDQMDRVGRNFEAVTPSSVIQSMRERAYHPAAIDIGATRWSIETAFVEEYMPVTSCVSLFLALGMYPETSGFQQAPSEQANDQQIERLIENLDHDIFKERESASKELERIGLPALARLKNAASTSSSLEVRRRAERTIQSIRGLVRPRLARIMLGLDLEPVADPKVLALFKPNFHGGLKVTKADPERAGAQNGIRAGDILVGLHHWETLTVDNVLFVLDHGDLASFSPLRYVVVRDGQIRQGTIRNLTVPK